MLRKLLLILPIITAVVAGCGTRPLAADEAARVGELTISMEDIDNELQRIPPYQRTPFESLQGKRTLLNHIIERELLLLAAQDAGLAEDSTVLAMTGDLEKQLEDIRTRAMSQVYYQTRIIDTMTVPDSLVEDYYQRNIEIYHNEPTALVSHILVSNSEKLAEAQAMLDDGVPFDSVAVLLSEHAATAPQGGSMGWTGIDLDIPFVGEDQELLQLLLSTEPGTVLPPYETNLGTHIFLVREQRPESWDPVEEVRPGIEDMLKPALVNDYFRNEFIPELHIRYNVTVNEEPVEGVYAVVGETEITEEDITAELEAIPPYQRSTYETPEGKKIIADTMVERELMRLVALEEGLENDSTVVAQVEQAEKQIEETMNGAMIQAYYQQYVVEAVTVPEEQVTAYYEEHTGDIYRQDPQVRISAIVTESEEEMALVNQALENQSFGETAIAMSVHEPTAEVEGDLGWIPMNAPVPYITGDYHFTADIHTADIGTLFGPVETNLGYTLIKVTDRLEEGVKPLEDVRESIEASLRPSVVNEYLYETVFPSLRETYEVEINEDAFLPSEAIGADSLMSLAQEIMGTDPVTAVTYFRLFLERYPENERCDQAQFLIGFTFSEQLKDYDAAREAFSLLVENYPESELADDAEWMIENMEIPIEEFIPADVETPLEEPASE
ncbi:hypothetical protein CSA37_09330 [Candidatus Fermentibacteria bacterium]|nr:MAG: hypothetical protein CSA37_09330 [Candidatus Fermentibacteria bacterium]